MEEKNLHDDPEAVEAARAVLVKKLAEWQVEVPEGKELYHLMSLINLVEDMENSLARMRLAYRATIQQCIKLKGVVIEEDEE